MACSKIFYESGDISKFMDRCQTKYGFPLPAIYSRFVSDKVSSETVNEMLNVNNINIRGGIMVTKVLIKFLFDLMIAIEKY